MTRRTERRSFRTEPEHAFPCIHCGRIVPLDAPGTRHRNHCPHCLSSRHVDRAVGDRRSGCGAPMDAIALWAKPDGEWSLIHRCRRCGKLNANRIAGDDDGEAIREIARRHLPPRGRSGSIRADSESAVG